MGDGAIRCDDGPRAVGGGLQASGRGPRTAGGGRQAAGYGPHAADGGLQAADDRLRVAGCDLRLQCRQAVWRRSSSRGGNPLGLASTASGFCRSSWRDALPIASRLRFARKAALPSGRRKSVAASPYDGSAFEMFHVKHFMIGKII